jgi:hypothetical protein
MDAFSGWLATGDLGLIGALALLGLVLASEVGFRLASRRHGRPQVSATQAATVQAAVLGLLALLLGFAFAAAMSRHDTRVKLTADEANAIGTAMLRAQLLPEPQRGQSVALLREHLAARIALHGGAAAPDAGKVRDALWSAAGAAAQRDPQSIPTGLYLAALNQAFDLADAQLAAVRDRVPGAVFAVLYAVALVAIGLTGYGVGTAERRNLRVTLLMSGLIAAVVVLIVDLDRPTSGLARVSPLGLLELQHGSAPPAR